MSTLRIVKTAERPDLKLWLLDDDGALIDLSSGYTFIFKIGYKGQTAVLSKTTGITGAAGTGTETSGTPNATVAFAAGDLDNVPKGTNYTWQLRATTGGVDRVFQGKLEVVDVVL